MEIGELQKLSVDELLNLSENNISDFRWNRAGIYRIAYEKSEKTNQKDIVDNIRKEILIFDLYNIETNKLKNIDKNFKESIIESIEYYKKRANSTNNPILKARYSDIVWEFDKDIVYARLAIRAYIDSCPIYFKNEWDSELSASIDRSIVIALSIKDKILIDDSIRNSYDFMVQLAEIKRFRYLLEIIDSILSQEKIKDQIDHEYIIPKIESAILYFDETISDSSSHIQRGFLGLLVNIWKTRKNQNEISRIKIRIAESFIKEAEWKRMNYPNGDAIAAHFYENAMKIYIELGNFSEKVDELKIKIKDAYESFLTKVYKITSSVKIDIPKETIDKCLIIYKDRQSIEIFQIMASDENLIPSYEDIKIEQVQLMKELPFRYIMPISIMKGNICICNISKPEEKLEYRTIENFRLRYYLTAHTLLTEIFDLLEKDHHEYMMSLITYLSTSEMVDEKRLELIKIGLREFNNKQYVASNHILIFQIEGILRDILGKFKVPTFSYRNNEMREIMLSDILDTLSQIEGIDTNFLKFIKIFLCDIRGDNFRNNVAHGLLSIESFTRENTQLLLLILIKLASYSIVKKNNK